MPTTITVSRCLAFVTKRRCNFFGWRAKSESVMANQRVIDALDQKEKTNSS